MCEVPIVNGPEVHEFSPVGVAVVLAVYPFVLLVLGKDQSRGELGANEALMIIGR